MHYYWFNDCSTHHVPFPYPSIIAIVPLPAFVYQIQSHLLFLRSTCFVMLCEIFHVWYQTIPPGFSFKWYTRNRYVLSPYYIDFKMTIWLYHDFTSGLPQPIRIESLPSALSATPLPTHPLVQFLLFVALAIYLTEPKQTIYCNFSFIRSDIWTYSISVQLEYMLICT